MTFKDSLIKGLTGAHALFVKSLSDIPEDKLTHHSHETENHALWTAGHMARVYTWWTAFLTKDITPPPNAFTEIFDNKKKPVAERAHYPAMSEVMAELDRQYNTFMKTVEALAEDDLFSAPIEGNAPFITAKIEVLTGQIHHLGWHTGQVSTLRRALSLPSLLGM